MSHNLNIDNIKSFGSLAHLVMGIKDIYFFSADTSKQYHYLPESDQILQPSPEPISGTRIPLIVNQQEYGTFQFNKLLDLKDKKILEKLVEELGSKLGLQRANEKANLALTILDNINDGIVACDTEGILKLFNRKTIEIHGLPDKPVSPEDWANYYDIYYPDGLTHMDKNDLPLYRALQGEIVEEAEAVIAPKGKKKTNIIASARPLINNKGEELGAFATLREESQLKKELEKVDSRFKTIFYQSPLSIQICTNDGKTILVNPAWRELWAIPDDVVENYILKDYNMLEDPTLEEQGVMEYIKKGYAGETTKIPVIPYDAKGRGLEGRERYVEGLIYPLKDNFGNVTEVVLIHIDVTEKKKSEKVQLFLASVSSILNTSLDYEKTIVQIADVCVHEFSEGCIIDLIEGEKIKRIVMRHKEEEIQKRLKELQKNDPITLYSHDPTARVLRSGQPELTKEVESIQSGFHTELGVKSFIVVPLIIRGKIIGSFTFLMTSGKSAFDELSLETAVEVAKRISFAIENSQLYRQLQKAIHLRDEFISLASHELKTPIAAMKLQFQLFDKGLGQKPEEFFKPDNIKKMVNRSTKQLNRINRLVDDMLDISRISAGKLVMHQKKCNISNLVVSVINQLAVDLEDLQKKLKTDIQENIFAACDLIRIEQVLTNLIVNANRYGEDKGIEVSLKKDKNNVILKVADHGPGISPEDLQRIFGRFERATSINISGLGLGLYQ